MFFTPDKDDILKYASKFIGEFFKEFEELKQNNESFRFRIVELQNEINELRAELNEIRVNEDTLIENDKKLQKRIQNLEN